MKLSTVYQLAALVAAVAAHAVPEAARIAEAAPVADAIAKLPRERDASGFHFKDDLSKRLLDKRNGWRYCGMAANADRTNSNTMYNQFGTEVYTVAPGCTRVKCLNTSGVYVCNDRNTVMQMDGNAIRRRMINILNGCCLGYPKYMGGQQFTDDLGGNWNVVIGYANCNWSKYTKPTEAGGEGVNGARCPSYGGYIG